MFAVGLALAIGACAGSPYRTVLSEWTRSDEVYEDLASRAFVHATLKTAPFREAYADEYARLFALDGPEREALREAERADDLDALVVVAAFYTPAQQWNDLDPRAGLWDVRLEGPEGRRLRPVRVRRLEEHNPIWRAMYPYFAPQLTLYELRFDRLAADGQPVARPGEPLALVIAGAPAQIRLDWTLPR